MSDGPIEWIAMRRMGPRPLFHPRDARQKLPLTDDGDEAASEAPGRSPARKLPTGLY